MIQAYSIWVPGCPSLKLGLCQALVGKKLYCYAKRSEHSYRPNVLPYRRKQESYWKASTAESFASHFLIMNTLKRIPYTAIRFNEAGDFWSQECIDKTEQIARCLKPHGIKCYCYTARSDLDYTGCRDLTVMGSGYKKEGMKGEFRMILKKEDRPKGWMTCGMDCTVCDRCQKGGNIVVLKH